MKHSTRALFEYDRTQPNRDRMWERVTKADVEAVVAEDADALLKLRLAFYEDTKHINCLDNCLIVDVAFIRKCVERKEQ